MKQDIEFVSTDGMESHPSRSDIVFVTAVENEGADQTLLQKAREAIRKRNDWFLFIIVERLALAVGILAILNFIWICFRGSIQYRELVIVSKFSAPFAFFASFFLPKFLTQNNRGKIRGASKWGKRLFSPPPYS